MPKKKQTPLMVRLPEDLHALVKELAEKENRSLNAQIITLLQDALALRRTLDAQRDGDLTKRTPSAA